MVFFKIILTFFFFANLTLVFNSIKAQVGLEDLEKTFNKSKGVTNNKVDKLYDNLQDNEYNQTHQNLKPSNQPITSVQNKYDCDSNNLSQEQIVECEYKIEQKVKQKEAELRQKEAELRQKKVEQSQMKKWSLEEARKINEGDWTKGYSIEEEERKEEERKTQAKKRAKKKATELKSLRDNRGKFGLSFSMTVNEADCESKELKFILDIYEQNPKEGLFCTWELVDGVEFISSFGKFFGEYTYSAHGDLRKKLSSIYKLLYRPSSSDLEKWNRDFSGKELTFMFENIKNPNEPKYILLNATRPTISNNGTTYSGKMYVEYIQESEGKYLINEQKRYETFSDDL